MLAALYRSSGGSKGHRCGGERRPRVDPARHERLPLPAADARHEREVVVVVALGVAALVPAADPAMIDRLRVRRPGRAVAETPPRSGAWRRGSTPCSPRPEALPSSRALPPSATQHSSEPRPGSGSAGPRTSRSGARRSPSRGARASCPRPRNATSPRPMDAPRPPPSAGSPRSRASGRRRTWPGRRHRRPMPWRRSSPTARRAIASRAIFLVAALDGHDRPALGHELVEEAPLVLEAPLPDDVELSVVARWGAAASPSSAMRSSAVRCSHAR